MNAALLRRQRRRFDWSCQFFWHSAIAPAYRVTAARNRRKPKFGHDHIIPSKASWDDCLCPKAANGNPVHKNPSDRPVPAKSSVQIEIVAFTEPQPVTFPGHADSTFVSARLFPGLPFCKQRFLLSDISFWSCNVRTAVISSVSVGLIESCGFGSRGCGTVGDRRCSLSNRRRLSPGIARDFASIGDGRVGVAKVARRYLRKFGISSGT